jgi:hypothetical protein
LNVHIFSDNPNLKSLLQDYSANKKYIISIHHPGTLKRILKNVEETALVYFDIENIQDDSNKIVNYLSKKNKIYFGIIDNKGKFTDISGLILSGAVDYVNTQDMKELFQEKRFKKIMGYLNKYRTDFLQDKAEASAKIDISTRKKYKIAPKGWQSIIEGQEYTFSFLYIELDGKEEMKEKYGKKNLDKALATFKSYIEKNIKAFDGRFWIWSGFGGVILFPFNGVECYPLLCAFRIILYKYMHDVEESFFPGFISFRMVMHLGTIAYCSKDTGNLISDTVNSIFHLGQRFTKPGNFYLTEEILKYAPEELMDFFLPVGSYENRNIFRMRLPVL